MTDDSIALDYVRERDAQLVADREAALAAIDAAQVELGQGGEPYIQIRTPEVVMGNAPVSESEALDLVPDVPAEDAEVAEADSEDAPSEDEAPAARRRRK